MREGLARVTIPTQALSESRGGDQGIIAVATASEEAMKETIAAAATTVEIVTAAAATATIEYNQQLWCSNRKNSNVCSSSKET